MGETQSTRKSSRTAILLSLILLVIGFLAYRLQLALPARPPSGYLTYTPSKKPAPKEIGSYNDVSGILDSPINVGSLTKAIWALKGKPTQNLQVPLDKDVTVGGKTFKAGTLLNIGLDVAASSLIPLGIRTNIVLGGVIAGVTYALCHAAVKEDTGRILEGATNTDLNAGLLIAMASNSSVNTILAIAGR
ncbi:hypothetical protein [Microcoleus sp. FACHB-672]|uniref:hypothetical protein n=1 Tax=Microcoleus sp. FACHB-672 TaxID=2692825 RepID=UPI001681FB7F|nr:hypothetical protein [Microcoleus sp. FACHB-672]MBD2043492.1 hypothetical protein [Microcoleus sp. FACHB-672]